MMASAGSPLLGTPSSAKSGKRVNLEESPLLGTPSAKSGKRVTLEDSIETPKSAKQPSAPEESGGSPISAAHSRSLNDISETWGDEADGRKSIAQIKRDLEKLKELKEEHGKRVRGLGRRRKDVLDMPFCTAEEEQRVDLFDALMGSSSFIFRGMSASSLEDVAQRAVILSVESGDVIAGPTHAAYKRGVGVVLIEGGVDVIYDKASRAPSQYYDYPGDTVLELEMLWDVFLDRSIQARTSSTVAIITHDNIARPWTERNDTAKLLMVLDSTARDARCVPCVGHKVALARAAWKLKPGNGLPFRSSLPKHHCFGTVKRVIRWNEYLVLWEDGSQGTYYTGWDNVEAVRRFNLVIISPPPALTDNSPHPFVTMGRRKSIDSEVVSRDPSQFVSPLVSSRNTNTPHIKTFLTRRL